jgi:hypothetical protein
LDGEAGVYEVRTVAKTKGYRFLEVILRNGGWGGLKAPGAELFDGR